MDALLVQRAMFKASGADIHAVSGLVQEYVTVARLANGQDGSDIAWPQVKERLEYCLRLYLGGAPIGIAKRISGCHMGRLIGHG